MPALWRVLARALSGLSLRGWFRVAWRGTGPRGESELLQEFRSNLQQKNKLLRSFIGMGYYGTITPAVIQRYILSI